MIGINVSYAQYASQQNAEYLAIVKAVANYKIDDAEEIRDVEALRNNQRFNEKLQKMLNKLQNTRTKDSKNQRVKQILERAGKDIENILN